MQFYCVNPEFVDLNLTVKYFRSTKYIMERYNLYQTGHKTFLTSIFYDFNWN